MAEHPIEARARAKAEDVLKFDSGDMRTGFCLGARFGHDVALSDIKKRLAAADKIVESHRSLTLYFFPHLSREQWKKVQGLLAAYDDAVKEAGNG